MSQKEYSKDFFTLVQENERLLDKPLKTKQLSYFQDAMLRFTKNKYNVIATIILSFMILLSIFVPILTPKDLYTQTNSSLVTLPPRVPLLEKLGIMDGTKEFEGQPVDLSTIDPVTGLGYPTIGFQQEYILMDTLKNEEVIGADRSALFVGGTNDLYVNFDRLAYAIITPTIHNFVTGQTIEVDIDEIVGNGIVKVYLAATLSDAGIASWDDLTLLGTATTVGVSTIDPFTSITSGTAGYVIYKYELSNPSVSGNDYVSLNSVGVKNASDEVVVTYTGYNLSTFNLYSLSDALENGRYVRNNAIMVVASFRYDVYEALFGDKPRTIGEVQYLQILADNPDMEDSIEVDPLDPNAWTFGEGFPLTKVTGITQTTIAGRIYRNYNVMMNGAYDLGFETAPYFLFGTNVFGQDLFTLIWLGLRTSLLLGFMAALVNIILGVIWGATSAYYGGQVDILMERFTDIWGSFPQITMIGIITVLIGPGFTALFIFMIYDGWIGAAKVTRSQFYRYKGREYVLAARTLGASDRRIIFKHILPNALGTIITRVILSIPTVIFLEVNLSYLGFGIGNGQALKIGPISLTGTSIGVILNDGQQQIFAGNLWMVVFPTIITSILMITFNMFGNALRDALNPQLRGSE